MIIEIIASIVCTIIVIIGYIAVLEKTNGDYMHVEQIFLTMYWITILYFLIDISYQKELKNRVITAIFMLSMISFYVFYVALNMT